MTLSIEFAGWFQCRMATDPDPTDEVRGVSGTAFALVDEPDFDGIIRFQNPVTLRSPGPVVGVRVTAVRLDDSPLVNHPIAGAAVSLDRGARFIEQNGAVVPANTAFIDPFDLRIESADGRVIARSALWDQSDPAQEYFAVPDEALRPRQVRSLELNVDEVKLASGIGEPEAFVAERVQRLREELETSASEPARRVGLEQRLDALLRTDWQHDRLLLLLGSRAVYAFDLNGPAVLDDIGAYAPHVPPDDPWTVRFWMGAWDNDALCGYVKGSLTMPSARL